MYREQELFSLKDVAAEFGVTKATVINWTGRGILPELSVKGRSRRNRLLSLREVRLIVVLAYLADDYALARAAEHVRWILDAEPDASGLRTIEVGCGSMSVHVDRVMAAMRARATQAPPQLQAA